MAPLSSANTVVPAEEASIPEPTPWFLLLVTMLTVVAVAVSVATVASTLYIVFHDYVRLPHGDEWEMIAHWHEKWRDTDSSWWHLFDQHNEHRIAVPRLIFFSDLKWFEGSGIFTLGCLISIQLIHSIFLCVLVCKSLRFKLGASLIAGGLVVLLMFSVFQIRNLVWGFQLQFVGVFALSTLAFFSLLQHVPTRSHPNSRISELPFALGIMFCIGATFTMANGLLTWPVGLLIAIQQRWSLRRLLAFLGIACLIWLAYFYDFEFVSGHSNPWEGLENIWPLAQYVAIYIGRPISPFWQEYAIGIGMVGILITTTSVILFIFDKDNARFDSKASRTLLAVSIFILLTALITGLGRVDFGLEQAASSRYSTPAVIYWISSITILLTVQLKNARMKVALRHLSGFLIFSAIASAITYQFKVPEIAEHLARTRMAAASSLLTGVYDKSAIRHIHPHPRRVMDKIGILQEERLSLFSTDAVALVGQPLNARLVMASGNHCTGHIDEVKMVKSDKNGIRLAGWAVNRQAQKRADTVLFVVDGTINGIAFSGRQRPDVEKIFPEISDSGWLGYAKIWPGETLQAYAVVSDGQAACLLNGVYQHQAKN